MWRVLHVGIVLGMERARHRGSQEQSLYLPGAILAERRQCTDVSTRRTGRNQATVHDELRLHLLHVRRRRGVISGHHQLQHRWRINGSPIFAVGSGSCSTWLLSKMQNTPSCRWTDRSRHRTRRPWPHSQCGIARCARCRDARYWCRRETRAWFAGFGMLHVGRGGEIWIESVVFH